MGFDNVLTSLGINGMKVFIRLNQREYDLSDTISGCVHLKAGQSLSLIHISEPTRPY